VFLREILSGVIFRREQVSVLIEIYRNSISFSEHTIHARLRHPSSIFASRGGFLSLYIRSFQMKEELCLSINFNCNALNNIGWRYTLVSFGEKVGVKSEKT